MRNETIHVFFDWMLTKRDKMYQLKHLMKAVILPHLCTLTLCVCGKNLLKVLSITKPIDHAWTLPH